MGRHDSCRVFLCIGRHLLPCFCAHWQVVALDSLVSASNFGATAQHILVSHSPVPHLLAPRTKGSISQPRTEEATMDLTPILQMYVFILAGFLGFQVITKVPALLHTPLMSATNAISGISLVGSLVAAGADRGTVSSILGFIAVTAATINVVGGFMITDRMLRMFRRQDKKPTPTA